jgi:hypothetical protein
MSSIKANLAGKDTFISTAQKNASNSRSYRSNYISIKDIENASLFVSSNNSDFESGISSSNAFEVDKIYPYFDNKYALVTLAYDGSKSKFNNPKSENIRRLNCGIIKVNLETNETNCLVPGLIPINLIENTLTSNIGDMWPVLQFGSSNKIYFKTVWTIDFSPPAGLSCSKYCLYKFDLKTDKIEKLGNKDYEYGKFMALRNDQLVFTRIEMTPSGDWVEGQKSQLQLMDIDGEVIELTKSEFDYPDGYSADDHTTVMHASPSVNNIEFTRYKDKAKRITYLSVPKHIRSLMKSTTGDVYGISQQDGFYQILPKTKQIIDSPNYVKTDWEKSSYCNETATCRVYYILINDIVVYTHIDTSNSKNALILKATRMSDNTTISLIKPSSNCSSHCFLKDDYNFYFDGNDVGDYTRWHKHNNILYADVIDLSTNNKQTLVFDFDKIDFSSDNVYSLYDTNGVLDNKEIKDIVGLTEIDDSETKPVASFDNVSANLSTLSIIFTKLMDKSVVENKLSIVDNSSNTPIGYMPVWINKKLHLVIDQDNGTVFDDQADPLNTGAYQITLDATASDVYGNTIGITNVWEVSL